MGVHYWDSSYAYSKRANAWALGLGLGETETETESESSALSLVVVMMVLCFKKQCKVHPLDRIRRWMQLSSCAAPGEMLQDSKAYFEPLEAYWITDSLVSVCLVESALRAGTIPSISMRLASLKCPP
jgi:hypothetical protein